MELLLQEIEKALEASLLVVPLNSALSIPDVCGALEHADNKANKRRYLTWYKNWVESKYVWNEEHPFVRQIVDGEVDISSLPFSFRGNHLVTFPADECYRFRCAMLHQGKAIHDQSKYKHIVYLKSVTAHNCIASHKGTEHVLFIDIPSFCKDVIDSARNWLEARKDNVIVQKNVVEMIQERPNVSTPYGKGPAVA